MWNLLGPGIEPVSPELAGGFFTTEPPGKPCLAVHRTDYPTLHHGPVALIVVASLVMDHGL